MTSSSRKVEVTASGIELHFLANELHRYDGPAITHPNGARWWYLHGGLHRADGPAVERVGGTTEWWLNGLRHRVDGPAVEYATGSTEWWLNGALHRVGDPAAQYVTGSFGWYEHGKPHRVGGGPAIKSPMRRAWFENGELHHVNGPADRSSYGEMSWHLRGVRLASVGRLRWFDVSTKSWVDYAYPQGTEAGRLAITYMNGQSTLASLSPGKTPYPRMIAEPTVEELTGFLKSRGVHIGVSLHDSRPSFAGEWRSVR